MASNTFKKAEHLTNKKIISNLFEKGRSFNCQPFKLIWLLSTEKNTVKLGISVPKRSFAKAVDRNLLKRRIREAYRKNKNTLFAGLEANKIPSCLGFVYIAKEKIPFEELEKKLHKVGFKVVKMETLQQKLFLVKFPYLKFG